MKREIDIKDSQIDREIITVLKSAKSKVRKWEQVIKLVRRSFRFGNTPNQAKKDFKNRMGLRRRQLIIKKRIKLNNKKAKTYKFLK